MTTRTRLNAELATRRYTRRHAREIVTAMLGNNSGTVVAVTDTRWYNIRLHGDPNQVVRAWNTGFVPPVPNLPVDVEIVKANGITDYQIVGVSLNRGVVADVNAGATGSHALQHQRRDFNTGGFDPLDIYGRAIVQLRARAQATPDMTLYVEAGWYSVAGIATYFAGGNSPAFTPPGSGFRCDLLYLNNAGTLQIVTGTSVLFGTPARPAQPTVNDLPLAYVYLAAATTSITEYLIEDGRMVFGGTSVAISAPTSAQYVTLALNATLSAERVLTAGEGITIADGGANGNVTVSQTRASAGIDTDANVFSAHHSLGGGGNQASPGDHVHPAGNGALTLSTNGGWCWFSDPRAVYYNNQTYFGYIDSSGNVKIRSFNHLSQSLSAEFTLHATLEVDDHDNPAILIRDSDKRILVFYSKHGDTVLRYRVSTNPEDITAFAAEQTINPNSGGSPGTYSYSNVIQLTGEANAPIYWFYRITGAGWTNGHVLYVKSTDGGSTWGTQVNLANITYAKFAQNGVDRIDITLSNHPADVISHNIYHIYYQGGSFYKSDGTLIASAMPFALTDLTTVYDGSVNKGWIWDIAIDFEGSPVIVYANFVGGVSDHRYRYAKWVNGAWLDNSIVASGDGTIYAAPGTEDYYSGGVVLDHQDPTIAYLSKYVSGKFEIWKYQTPDNGATWTGTAITSGSSDKNIRPVAVRNHASDLKFIWLEGTYTTYTNYSLSVKGYGSGVTSFAPSANAPQDVGSAAAVGTGTNPPHDDHVHKGVHSLAKSGGSALYGDVTISGIGGIAINPSGNNLAIDGSGVSGGGSDHLHGIARWLADGSTTNFELPDQAEYLEWATDNGSLQDQLTVSLATSNTQLAFNSAPTAGHILQAEYVIQRI